MSDLPCACAASPGDRGGGGRVPQCRRRAEPVAGAVLATLGAPRAALLARRVSPGRPVLPGHHPVPERGHIRRQTNGECVGGVGWDELSSDELMWCGEVFARPKLGYFPLRANYVLTQRAVNSTHHRECS